MDMMKSDADPQETREWLDALAGVLAAEGPDRAHFLIEQLIDTARRSGAYLPFSANTAYINTIGHFVLPAPMADAGLLAVSDGVDGAWPTDGDLPGALHEIPAGSRSRGHRGTH